MKLRSLILALSLLASPALAQWQVPSNTIPLGKGPGFSGFNTVGGSAGAGSKCLLDTTPPSFGTCASSVNTRVTLTGNTTFYVRSDGNDTTCNGTANASAASAPNCAKLTWNSLYSKVAAGYDFSGFSVTLTSGTVSTYTGLAINNPWVGGGQLTIDLNSATIAETTTKAIINNSRQSGGIIIQNGIVSSTNGACIQNSAQTTMFVNNIAFGNCSEADFEATQGGIIFLTGASNIFTAGSAGYHFLATYAGSAIYPVGATDTFTGNRTYSGAFASAIEGATIKADGWSCSGATGCAVVGAGFTITGPRYLASLAGNIFTNNAGANFFPGSVAGTLLPGGCYDLICALDGTIWTTYTPTVAAQTGTCTSCTATGRYKQIGKTIFVEVDTQVVTVGTASGIMTITLPFNSALFRYTGNCFDYGATFKSGGAFISGPVDATKIQTTDAAGVTFFGANAKVACSVTYEVP